jgi:two-component system CheB/CheR fusion protein
MRILPYRTVDNVIAGVVITITDVTRIMQAEERINALSQTLRNRVESLETLLDLVPVGILIAEDRGSENVQVNKYGAQLLGRTPDEDKLTPIPIDLKLRRDGVPVDAQDQPLRIATRTAQPIPGFEGQIVRDNGSTVDVLMSANPLFDEEGGVRGAIASMVDITYRKKAEARQEMLLHELQHRVKNILATVAALASRMVKASTTIEQFSTSFVERLRAMGRVHEVLSRHQWEGADVKLLISTALNPYANEDNSNIAMSGPAVLLKSNAAATLGMVLFELANNAAKYGALSAEKGRIELNWRVDDKAERQLELTWRERDGPRIETQPEKSFGTNFIERSLEYELGGSAELKFEPSGLQCILRVPLNGDAEEKENSEPDAG